MKISFPEAEVLFLLFSDFTTPKERAKGKVIKDNRFKIKT